MGVFIKFLGPANFLKRLNCIGRFHGSVPGNILLESSPAQEQGNSSGSLYRLHSENGAGLLSCLEIDIHGQIYTGRYLKSALCTLHGLQTRDLRKLDGTLKNQLPAILVRPGSFLVHLDHIRAIVTHCSVTLFENGEASTYFVEELAQRIKSSFGESISIGGSGNLPFEFVSLEAILARVTQSLQEEVDRLLPEIEEHMATLQRNVHWDKLMLMLECKKRVNAMMQKANAFRNCLHELLESDDDMANMYLSHRAASNGERPVAAHEEVELLLESYLKTMEEIAARVVVLEENIRSTEKIVNIGLVSQRNELLLLELKLGIGTFAASMGGFGASILGMNLQNHFEASPSAFYAVLFTLLGVSGVAFGYAWRRMLLLLRSTKYHQPCIK
jgi:magnesium transporter